MKNKEKKPDSHIRRIFLLLISVLVMTVISCRQDETLPDSLHEAEQQSLLKSGETWCDEGDWCGDYKGGFWQISLPEPNLWNNTESMGMPRIMVFYAHGMVDPYPYEEIEPLADVIEGIPVKNIIKSLGMGYATTSYRDNGLVVLNAIHDIQQLTLVVKKFFLDHPEYLPPDLLILGGPSEGGLVTVKTLEKYPQLFDGGISICGPIGNFADQLKYNGDFHVLFNYFFKDELIAMKIDLGSPEGVPESTMDAWKSGYLMAAIVDLLVTELAAGYPNRIIQLLNVLGATETIDMTDSEAIVTAVIQMLRYNIMLTNDVIERMKGVPYTNVETRYAGSLDDVKLNKEVERSQSQSYKRARNFISHYETSGRIAVPLVIIHTTDHITPFWHQEKYASKINPRSSDLLCRIDVDIYGHCTIGVEHIMNAFACLAENMGFSLPPVTPELSQQ
jgi:pimeloyl-ACP methyl ester carboxylesterase